MPCGLWQQVFFESKSWNFLIALWRWRHLAAKTVNYNVPSVAAWIKKKYICYYFFLTLMFSEDYIFPGIDCWAQCCPGTFWLGSGVIWPLKLLVPCFWSFLPLLLDCLFLNLILINMNSPAVFLIGFQCNLAAKENCSAGVWLQQVLVIIHFFFVGLCNGFMVP